MVLGVPAFLESWFLYESRSWALWNIMMGVAAGLQMGGLQPLSTLIALSMAATEANAPLRLLVQGEMWP